MFFFCHLETLCTVGAGLQCWVPRIAMMTISICITLGSCKSSLIVTTQLLTHFLWLLLGKGSGENLLARN